jgi:hypothetical protein
MSSHSNAAGKVPKKWCEINKVRPIAQWGFLIARSVFLIKKDGGAPMRVAVCHPFIGAILTQAPLGEMSALGH